MPTSPAEERRQALLSGIIAYECNDLTDAGIAALFQELHDTGLVYEVFHGRYTLHLKTLIESGAVQAGRVTSLRRAEPTFTGEQHV